MNLEYKYLLDGNFHPDSRVLEIEQLLRQFALQWKSHGTPVKGEAHLFFGQFIVFIADETATGISGCSTDSSVRLIKDIEQRFGVNMFDRTTLAFFVKGKVELVPMSQLQYAFENGFMNGDTLYFNNLVQSKEELENKWIVPIKDSWLAARFSFSSTVS